MRAAVALFSSVAFAASAQAQTSAPSQGWTGFNFPTIGGPDVTGGYGLARQRTELTPTMRRQRDAKAANLLQRVRETKALGGGVLTAEQERAFTTEAAAIYR